MQVNHKSYSEPRNIVGICFCGGKLELEICEILPRKRSIVKCQLCDSEKKITEFPEDSYNRLLMIIEVQDRLMNG